MKFSIVVPIYKVEKYLKRCVDSILSQTYSNLEIILVNDGSPDDCGKICDEYAKIDKRVKVLHKENGGLSAARNSGTSIASGDYIWFIDSDDYIEKSACEELKEVILEYNPEVVCFNFKELKEIDDEEFLNPFYVNSNTKNVTILSYEEAIIENIYKNKVRNEAQSRIYKNEIAKKQKFPEGILGEDFATFYKFLKLSKKTVYYDRCLYNYYHRGDSIMGKKSEKLYLDLFFSEIEYYDTVKSCCANDEDLNKLEDNHFKVLIKTFVKLSISQNNYDNIIEKVNKELKKIDDCKLSRQSKILLALYKINNNIPIYILKYFYKNL